MVGHQARRDAHDEAMSLAWHIAALERQKKLPALKTLLSKRRGEQRQTVSEQKHVLQMLSAQYGIPLRQAGKKVTG